MTNGVMVGGHGQTWETYVTPATTTGTSATPVLSPSTAPTIHASPPARVIAGTDLPRAASTHAYVIHDLSLTLTQDKFLQQVTSSSTLSLQIVGGMLVAGDNKQLSFWLPLLPLATDVHTEAATLSYADSVHGRNPQGRDKKSRTLRLTLTRLIKAGETLPFWFSSEVAAQLGLPFLNFSHIRDGAYVCPKCDRQFSAPNPLKLHLASRCDTLPPLLLWNRILDSTEKPTCTPWFTPLLSSHSVVHDLQLTLKRSTNPLSTIRSTSAPTGPRVPIQATEKMMSPTSSKPASPDSTSSSHLTSLKTSPSRAAILLQEPQIRFLDELAVITVPSLIHFQVGHGQPTCSTQSIMPSMPLAGGTRPLLADQASTPAVDPCAEMETLVSNLGRSRRGHLCLYCGKIYSRKYGLKIHIRTHTGYKPLKCKVCLRPFGDPSNLNKHVRLHAEGETPYRCDHCGKVLVRRRDLDRHIKSRHPELPPTNTNSLTDTDEDGDDEDDDDDDDDDNDSEILDVDDNDITLESVIKS
ncbi:PR domain zinc finger protein 13 [Halocaridina rubra]|uniref:PR domain zinc finger protein 13 n=1 Tax=Halocaridina rubra TaxID=373956 RepID=A0AAN8X9M7_HALRR